MGRLDGKVAVITGAARGIGKQIALTFAREGADVVCADVADTEGLASELRDLGRKALAVKTDVTKKAEVERLADETIRAFERIDLLVNNAGIVRPAGLMDLREDDWDAVLDVNLKGVLLCTQAVAGHMVKAKSGRIINIASVAGLNTVAGPVASYAPSKAGVIQLTKVSALELGPHGINVNAIAPGPVITDLTYEGRTRAKAEEYIEASRKKAVLGRLATPEDIANVALFLASEESSMITGQTIAVDGGKTGLLG